MEVRFTDAHKFIKPNDDRGLGLMNRCAEAVMNECSDAIIAIGHSDEFSFVLKRDCNMYGRRNR
jgi:tRNA(His) guanylyltransferase